MVAGAGAPGGVQSREGGVGPSVSSNTRTGVLAAGDKAVKYELHVDKSSEKATELHQQLLDAAPDYFKLPQLLTQHAQHELREESWADEG